MGDREQQDAQEFYSGCIDALSTDIGLAVKRLTPLAPIIQGAVSDASSANAPVEIYDAADGAAERGGEKVQKVVLPAKVMDFKRSNVCNLNVNLQVTAKSKHKTPWARGGEVHRAEAAAFQPGAAARHPVTFAQ